MMDGSSGGANGRECPRLPMVTRPPGLGFPVVRTNVALRAQPDHLLVILLKKDGMIEEIYNGPGHLAWTNCGKQQKNGQSSISMSKLRHLMHEVPAEQRLPRKHP